MRRGLLVALLGFFVSGCFCPNIRVGGDKPLVDIKYDDKKDKERDTDRDKDHD